MLYYLIDFKTSQIIKARQLGYSISKVASLVRCSWYAIVSTFQTWSKEGQLLNWHQDRGCPRVIDEHGEQRLACLVRSHKRATVAQLTEVNAGHSLQRMGLHSWAKWPLPTTENAYSGHVSIRIGPWSNVKTWPCLRNHIFFYIT